MNDEWSRIETDWDRELEAQGHDLLRTAGEFCMGKPRTNFVMLMPEKLYLNTEPLIEDEIETPTT